ncbi:MAG: thioredoxin family protein [Pirellulaceae bacterium]
MQSISCPLVIAFLLLVASAPPGTTAQEPTQPAAGQALQSLEKQLAAAVSDARLTYQHVFVLLGSLEGGPVLRLYEDLHQEHDSLAHAMQNYRILPISTADPQRDEVRKLLQKLKVQPAIIPDQFLVLFLDEQGKLLGKAAPESFYRGEGENRALNRPATLASLKKHAPPPLSSRELLDNALADAKQSGRRVIVQETATWCGPCILLSRFLEKHRALWQRDYLWVKLDHRWPDTEEVVQDLRGDATYPIPWWAILNAEGETLITSIRAGDQNIGFPSSDEGKAHFREMLNTTAVRLQPEQIEVLIDDLK